MKTKIISSLLFVCLFGISQLLAQTGMWNISNAKAPDGTGYTGIISIGTYESTWNLKRQISTGWTNGVGISIGQSVFFAWNTDNAHLMVFQEGPAGDLTGTSTSTKTMGKTGSEIIKSISLQSLEGTYTLEGKKASDGGKYSGTVSITKFGDVYKVKYISGTISHEGIGFVSGKVFAIAFGSGTGFGLTEYVFTENTATGKFAQAGMQTFGTETLSKAK